jgi:uncharacterized protein (DUF39 family)
MKKEVGLNDLLSALLCNPRNGYQNYNCAVNLSDKTVYTYMGMLKPNCRNANFCSAGELSPLLNDPWSCSELWTSKLCTVKIWRNRNKWQKVSTLSFSSAGKARAIAEILKKNISDGQLLLNNPAELLPDGRD